MRLGSSDLHSLEIIGMLISIVKKCLVGHREAADGDPILLPKVDINSNILIKILLRLVNEYAMSERG